MSPAAQLGVNCLTYLQLRNLRIDGEGVTRFAAFSFENDESEGQ